MISTQNLEKLAKYLHDAVFVRIERNFPCRKFTFGYSKPIMRGMFVAIKSFLRNSEQTLKAFLIYNYTLIINITCLSSENSVTGSETFCSINLS